MTHPPTPETSVHHLPGQGHDDARAETELARLRTEFPGHWISIEPVVGRGVRYLARACQPGSQPHTVLTHDLGELRAALEASRPAGQEPPQP